MVCEVGTPRIKVEPMRICAGMEVEELQMILKIMTEHNLTPKQLAEVVNTIHGLDKKYQKPVLAFAKSVQKINAK